MYFFVGRFLTGRAKTTHKQDNVLPEQVSISWVCDGTSNRISAILEKCVSANTEIAWRIVAHTRKRAFAARSIESNTRMGESGDDLALTTLG